MNLRKTKITESVPKSVVKSRFVALETAQVNNKNVTFFYFIVANVVIQRPHKVYTNIFKCMLTADSKRR